ncbi:MAG: histidine phosphatase family protein [Firmicutes bacterium]|nr:histidine phosphatase family protein [Bacillota bacterium]
MRLLLVRHGETVANVEGRFQGQREYPLTPRGLQQAEAMRKRLEALPIDLVFSSDLSRALQTAQVIVTGRALSITIDPRLREYRWGAFEGLTHAGIRAAYPELGARLREEWGSLPIPGKEDPTAFVERIDAFLQALLEGVAQAATVLIVAHGRLLNGMLVRLLGLLPQRRWPFSCENGALTVVDWHLGNQAWLRVYNEIPPVLQPAPWERRRMDLEE